VTCCLRPGWWKSPAASRMSPIPRERFKGQTGQGDWADSLLELDSDFGTLLDLLDELGLAGDSVVVFAGDNGPEEVLLWRGTPGYWEGSYFAGGEGNLRTPCIVRWPGRIRAGRVSDDIMHVTDWFTTLLRAAGAAVYPRARPWTSCPCRIDDMSPVIPRMSDFVQGGSTRSVASAACRGRCAPTGARHG
jgi:arylsulfatase A-like enzyme